jgi:hypothetical protein
MLQRHQAIIERRSRTLKPLAGARRPWGANTDECSQDIGDRRSIILGVRCDPLQGTDTADSHLCLVISKLVNGVRKTFSDLPIPADLDLAPRADQSNGNKNATQRLKQGSSSIVLQVALRLLKLDPLLHGRHLLQLSGRQRRIQQPRKNHDADCQCHDSRDGQDREPHCDRPSHDPRPLPRPQRRDRFARIVDAEPATVTWTAEGIAKQMEPGGFTSVDIEQTIRPRSPEKPWRRSRRSIGQACAAQTGRPPAAHSSQSRAPSASLRPRRPPRRRWTPSTTLPATPS